MARFLGSVKGCRGEASRLGGAAGGLRTVAASWHGAVKVWLYVRNGKDWVTVSLIPWRCGGIYRLLYDGPVSGQRGECFAENEL